MEEIVIFGCGIAGMLTAIALAKNGIKTTIIEKKSEEDIKISSDPRTNAFNKSSKDFMQKIDVYAKLEAHMQEIKDIYVCQNMKDKIFHMQSSDNELGLMIENSILREALYQITKENKLIEILFSSSYENIEFDEGKIYFDLISDSGKKRISAKLSIAADGRFSEAKKQFFSNRLFRDYKQSAMVFNISHSVNHEGGAIEHFLKRGSFATLPLSGGYKSGIVWVEETEISDFYRNLQNEKIVEIISKFIGESLGEINIDSKIEAFPLGAFISEKYYFRNLVLVADSAHGMHPLAGQGLNMGIKDVESLVNLIVKNTSLGLDFDEVMLDKYEKERKVDNIKMVRITDVINKIFTSKSSIVNFITENALGIIDKAPLLKELLISYAKGNR